MKKSTPILASAMALALAASAGSASAATVTLTQQTPGNTFGSPNYSETVTRVIGVNPIPGANRGTTELPAGLFRLVEDGIKNILAFCIEPGITLQLGQTFDTAASTSLSAAQLVDVDKLFTSSYTSVVDAASAAGFQLALWEIAAETSMTYDLSAGNHSITVASAGALSAGSTFLNNIASASTGGFTLTTYVNGGQDLISASPSPVPLPAGGLLILSGLGAFAALRRKKSKA